jgi:hypothetical protein
MTWLLDLLVGIGEALCPPRLLAGRGIFLQSDSPGYRRGVCPIAGPTGAVALQHVHAGLIRLLDAIDIAARKQEHPSVHEELQRSADTLQQALARLTDAHNELYPELQASQGGTPAWQDHAADDEAGDDALEDGLKRCRRAIILTKSVRRMVEALRKKIDAEEPTDDEVDAIEAQWKAEEAAEAKRQLNSRAAVRKALRR